MPVHTYSSRNFTRDVGAAKRAAADGPVFITDRGRPAFALLFAVRCFLYPCNRPDPDLGLVGINPDLRYTVAPHSLRELTA
jgi:hypothetical protein